MYFITVAILTIAQRIYELKVAKENTQNLLSHGGVEFGAKHYWMLVTLHTLFFSGMFIEAFLRGVHPPEIWPILFALFLTAQAGRAWVIRTLHGRWTTRILVVPGEKLVDKGPFKIVPHPNYMIVAVEILTLPLIFGLYYTSIIFTVLNALVLLAVRIPEERRALNWATKSNH